MPVVAKYFGYSHAPHDRERDVVYNAGIISHTTLEGQPCGLPIFHGRHDKIMPQLHLLAQSADGGALGSAGSGVATFEQDETARHQIRSTTRQFRKARLCRTMLLVAFVPDGQ